MRPNTLILVAFIGVLSLSACSKFQQIRSNPNLRVQLDAAYQYYEEEDYYRAAMIFQDLIPIYRGRPEAQKMQFTFAYCHYYEEDYLLASHYFKTFFDTYRRSDRAEEALFRSAQSLCFEAPATNLDQSSTYDAIQSLQGFINLFPNSEYTAQAAELLDQQQRKLERKAFDNALLYYKIRRYEAAMVAFENFENDYPDSELREEAHYYTVKAASEYADGSALHKQEERYRKTISLQEDFVDTYPESEFGRELARLADSATRGIARLARIKEQVEEERKAAEERERRRRENVQQREQEAELQQ